uniref:Uncharacterized protein n=1 Tax=Tetraodon nigroviridis TaxID=99883 RepID=H3CYF8_TETNG
MTFHNLVFVVDADHGAQDPELDAKKQLLKRGLLQVLVLLGCRFGFDRVRWGYTFSRSGSGRTPRLVSRGSDFRELGQKTFEDLEVELESRFDPAAGLQKALREALLDFQWDRPDLTSPTKLSLRPRSSARAGRSGSREDDVSGSRNLVLVVAECPRSGTQLSRFLSLGSQDLPADPTEHLLSRGLRDLLLQRRVALHWVDSSSPEQVASCEDHLGFQRLSQVLAQVDGSVLPLVSLLDLCSSHQNLALRSSIGYLLCPDAVHRLAFPVLTGTLEWNQGAPGQRCHVLLEPLCRGQKLLPESVRVRLTAVLQDWDSSALRQPASECWVLHRSGCSAPGAEAFRHLLTELSARRLHLLSEVDDGGLLCSAVLSPLSPSAALLSLLPPDVAQARLLLTHQTSPAATGSTHLPRVVGGLLGVVCDLMEHSDTTDEPPSDPPVPEWAQQEVRLHPLGGGVLESWFPLSDQAGVSSHLMESMRVLHAVAEPQEPAVLAPELISGLAEVYQTRQPAGDRRARKRGAQRTPVKQKMRSMSRSLQMVNVARLNVKALKSQPEAEQPEAPQGAARRCSERKKRGEARFSSEAALLAHLSSAYDSALSGSQPGLPAAAQLLLSAVKAFFGTEQVRVAAFVQQHLLRSSRRVRQVSSADSKVRECQLQVLLRLELCALSSPELDTEQASEEVADLLRIISLTQDPVCLTRFLQDHVLPGFLAAVPRVLAQVYHSLGTQLPEALLALLPADFFSDESVSKDSVSPSASASVSSPASEAGNQLQSLRDRSAHRRKSSALTRHRSMTESSQSLRQIEMPQRTSRAARSRVCSAAEATKEETQEVTKVRRNLFNQEVASPSKKAKMPRSRSVSALEGLRRKRCQASSSDQHRLLTRTVCETPLHKQVSKRLLQRQRMGSSVPAEEEGVVEESPVKPAEDLRRSPRIRRFARRRSGSFYAGSQPRSRPLEAASAWQQPAAPPPVTSPMRLLFGAARSPPALPETSASEGRSGAGVPSPETPPESPDRRRLPTRTRPRAAGPPRTPKTPPFSRAESGEMVLRGSPFRSPAGTPTKLQSPLRGILRTPIRALGPGPSPGLEQLRSPVCRTPRKSVTWSPHQRGGTLVRDAAFKVPEWPQTPQRYGPGSPAESTGRNISRSLEQQTLKEPTSRPSAGPPEPEDGADGSPARSLAGRRSSHQGVGTRAPSAENLNWSGSRPSEVQSELSQTPDGGSGCSRLSSTSTDDSLDIVEAAVTRAQFTGGLRMNISFSRRSSQSQNLPAAPEPSGGTPARSYGLRQTPDRRQREAAARLGYGNQPRCSTPRCSAGPGPRKEPGPQNPLSYQVELERQTSGVPKLNLKRTDSAFRGSRQREPGRGSPPSCAHTPAKSTPGKGLQTFICQSCTPTRRPGGTVPPVGAAEGVPLTPSPQGLGRTPPDHLNSWPRRKR